VDIKIKEIKDIYNEKLKILEKLNGEYLNNI
jgi:hypothetical protein